MSTTPALRFGWLAEQRMSASELLATTKWVEQLGYDSVWLSDHLADDSGGWLHDPWTTLGALLASVPRITAGTLVASNSLRAPLLTAQMTRTLAEIAPGRFVLGLGAGGSRTEHLRVGVTFPDFDRRVDDLRETCELVRRTTSSDSPWNASADPSPATRAGVPLVLGGTSAAILELAATHADGWAIWGSPVELSRQGELLSGFARAAGREPQDVLRAAIVMLLPDHLPERKGQNSWPAELRGDEDAVAHELVHYVEAGVSEIVVCDYGVAPSSHLTALEWFATVMGRFHGTTRKASTT